MLQQLFLLQTKFECFYCSGFVPNTVNIMTFECFEQIVDKLIARSAGVSFGRANGLLAKAYVETRKEGRKWGESKGAVYGAGK